MGRGGNGEGSIFFPLGIGNWGRWGADGIVFGFMRGEGLDFGKMGEGYRWCQS